MLDMSTWHPRIVCGIASHETRRPYSGFAPAKGKRKARERGKGGGGKKEKKAGVLSSYIQSVADGREQMKVTRLD